jgi:predicted RNA binding protein YcfA (HicA-like mRNA interferase family)
MKPEAITFADVEKLLFRLGFTACETKGAQKVYRHPPSDTLIMLPPYQSEEILRPIHLAAVQIQLVQRELISQAAFEGALEKIDRAYRPFTGHQ